MPDVGGRSHKHLPSLAGTVVCHGIQGRFSPTAYQRNDMPLLCQKRKLFFVQHLLLVLGCNCHGDLLRGDGQLVEASADGVVDGVRDGGQRRIDERPR